MAIYFTADQHFGHHNVIKHAGRPFASVEEMDAMMVKNWNEVVTNQDTVYILGDLFWGQNIVYFQKILNKLKGNKCLITGNHDDPKKVKKLKGFCWAKSYYEFKHQQQKFVLFHYPISNWNGMYHESIHLHGHSHGQSQYQQRRYDVGVDCHNYRPVSIKNFLLTVEQ